MLRRMFAQTGDQALKAFRQLCLRGWSVSCYYWSELARITRTHVHRHEHDRHVQISFTNSLNMSGHCLFSYTSSLHPHLHIEAHTNETLTCNKQASLVIMNRIKITPPSGRNVTMFS